MTESLPEIILRLDKEATPGPWVTRPDKIDPTLMDLIVAAGAIVGTTNRIPYGSINSGLISEYRTLAPRLAERYVAMEKALELIKELANSTLISPSMGYDYDQAYREGAHNAFSNAADIASAVLAKAREG